MGTCHFSLKDGVLCGAHTERWQRFCESHRSIPCAVCGGQGWSVCNHPTCTSVLCKKCLDVHSVDHKPARKDRKPARKPWKKGRLKEKPPSEQNEAELDLQKEDLQEDTLTLQEEGPTEDVPLKEIAEPQLDYVSTPTIDTTELCPFCAPEKTELAVTVLKKSKARGNYQISCQRCKLAGPLGLNKREAERFWDALPRPKADACTLLRDRLLVIFERELSSFEEASADKGLAIDACEVLTKIAEAISTLRDQW